MYKGVISDLSSSHELTRLAQSLHVFANLDVGLEVFGNTSVQTERFLLIELALRVVLSDALGVTLLNEGVEHAGHHVQLGFSSLDLLLGRHLGGTADSEHYVSCL